MFTPHTQKKKVRLQFRCPLSFVVQTRRHFPRLQTSNRSVTHKGQVCSPPLLHPSSWTSRGNWYSLLPLQPCNSGCNSCSSIVFGEPLAVQQSGRESYGCPKMLCKLALDPLLVHSLSMRFSCSPDGLLSMAEQGKCIKHERKESVS